MEFCALYLILKNSQSALFMEKWYCLLYGYFALHAKLVKPILHDQVSFGGILKICGHILNTLDLFSFSFSKLLAISCFPKWQRLSFPSFLFPKSSPAHLCL